MSGGSKHRHSFSTEVPSEEEGHEIVGHGPGQLLAAGSGALWTSIISHSLPLNNQSTLDITPDLCSPVGRLLFLCDSKDSELCGWSSHHPMCRAFRATQGL